MAVSLEGIQKSTEAYFKKFDIFLGKYGLGKQRASTIGWKTTDIDEFNDTLSGFLENELVTQCHIGFVDKRYIASIVFKEPIYSDVHILKLMRRRPNSKDPVGLDHVDFLVDDLVMFENELNKQKVPNWEHESNEAHRWISVRFDGTEAKFVDHIVLDVGVKELQDITKQLGFKPKSVN